MASPKPTIMLVHGAYSSPELFGPIKTKLEALSYDVVTVQLPTSDRISADKTVNDDVEAIRSAIIPYIDGGKEVVIATHSYGGIPGCASTEGLSVKERAAQGKRGGFRAILFMAAFALPKAGVTCNDSFGKEVPEWLDLVDGFGCTNEKAREAFYNDLPDEEGKYWLEKAARPTSLATMFTPVNFIPSDLKIPCTYMICEKDKILDVSWQENIVTATPGMKSERCNAGHFPFISQPDRTVEVIVKVAEGW